MNIQEYLNQWKTIQVSLLQFIDTEDNKEDEFNKLIKVLSNFGIASKKTELKLFLHLLCQISRYHHRLPDFFDKIEQIIKYYAKDISMAINKTELFNVFKNSPKVLLFLYNQQMVTINQARNRVYFYHEKLQNGTKEEKKWILENINKSYIENNEEKRQKGENDLYICELIRNDSVNDFIIYVNKNAINLKSQINPSYYETHSFLSEKEPSLIEYAVFFGSIEIFNYLKLNDVPLTPSLLYYAIHSNSDVMIHTLINDDVKPLDDNYGALYKEAIKCHHNETANFIGDYFLKDKDEFESNHFQSFVKFYNFSFINENLINNKELFGLLCCTDYISLVDHFLNTFKDIDVNAIIRYEEENDNDNFREEQIDYDEITDNKTVLHVAIENDSIDLVQLLLKQPKIDYNKVKLKADFEATSTCTPLSLAVTDDYVEIVKLLLNFESISINNKETLLFFGGMLTGPALASWNKAPLFIAVENENAEIVQLLLNCEKLDVNLMNKGVEGPEMTALHLAVLNEEIDIIKLLLNDKRIDVNIKNSESKTPIEITKNEEIIKLFKEHE